MAPDNLSAADLDSQSPCAWDLADLKNMLGQFKEVWDWYGKEPPSTYKNGRKVETLLPVVIKGEQKTSVSAAEPKCYVIQRPRT